MFLTLAEGEVADVELFETFAGARYIIFMLQQGAMISSFLLRAGRGTAAVVRCMFALGRVTRRRVFAFVPSTSFAPVTLTALAATAAMVALMTLVAVLTLVALVTLTAAVGHL